MVKVGEASAPSGYEHPTYATSLSEFGSPVLLPRSGGWALKRRIEGSSQSDMMGPYPLFFCRDWHRLPQDLADVAGEVLSFSMVTDPFAKLTVEFLKSNFDVAIPFKDHFITELSRPIETIVSRSHLNNVKRALKKVEVALCPDPTGQLAEWVGLFGHLTKRHQIRGIKAFSEQAFAQQFRIPGMVLFEAKETATGACVGMDLWYLQRNVAYGHLAAFSERGYALRASYATKWQVLHYFADKAEYLHLGAEAGNAGEHEAANGLTHFKRGWSTGTLKNYFCGKVFDAAAYAKLVRDNKAEGVSFFPAYRKGEF